MRFLELDCDPWREQGFLDDEPLPTVRIPADDDDAFDLYPRQRWVYDRLRLAQSSGLECGTHETLPRQYPVFCKPITALGGMGHEGCVLLNDRDHREHCRTGNFWMRWLAGEHLSTDMPVVAGDAAWCRHALGVPSGAGRFDYWVIEERPRPRLERFCRDWTRANLPGYTGVVNVETLGGCIISVHLRSADQWRDLYGRKWLDALVGLYGHGTWDLVDSDRAEGYSVPLFGPPGLRHTEPDPRVMAEFRATMGISSIRLARFADRLTAAPAGIRLAVINSFNLEVALRLRAAMAREFGVPDPGGARRITA